VQSEAGNPPGQSSPNDDAAQTEQPAKQKKKGFFSKLFGKGDSGDKPHNNGASTTENGNNTSPK
jgi:hypothetical protein